MKFKPALPEHNDNVPQEHPLKDFAFLLLGLFAFIVVVYFVIGLFVDFFAERISPEREYEWFQNSTLSRQITRTLTGSADLKPLEVEGFEQLKSCAGVTIPIALYVHESDLVNAVAVPGGSVIVYRGLLDQLDSKNGLDFVLAHELGHFKHRDHLKSMGRGVVILGGLALLSGGNSRVVNLVSSFTGFEQAKFSQARESDADQLALDVLNCRHGHVGGAKEFFESVDTDDSFTAELGHYFSTHPEVSERLDQLDMITAARGYRVMNTTPLDETQQPETPKN